MLIVGSGNVVHNLRALDWSQADDGFDWAHRFDDDARDGADRRPERRAGAARATATSRHARPTPDHFIPLLYLAGLADAAGEPRDVLVDGYAFGSLSMTSYTLDG